MNAVRTTIKIIFAVMLLAGAILFVARDVFPEQSASVIITWIVLGGVVLMAVLALWIWVGSRWNGVTFRKGGLDAGWLWFGGNPRGVAEVRSVSRGDSEGD